MKTLRFYSLWLSVGAVCSTVFFWFVAGHFAKASIALACVGSMVYLTADMIEKGRERGKE